MESNIEHLKKGLETIKLMASKMKDIQTEMISKATPEEQKKIAEMMASVNITEKTKEFDAEFSKLKSQLNNL